MQDRLNIAVFVDYDNIEIGLRSTLARDLDVALILGALKERGDIVAKFAYANWGRQEGATRQMAENAVQMVQRVPTFPRGDKNGADINLALDALEMAFTHTHVNAFAIVSGDSDFVPLLNKLKEYGKTVFVVGGKGFTSTILQQNCHEFISLEALMPDATPIERPRRGERGDRDRRGRRDRGPRDGQNIATDAVTATPEGAAPGTEQAPASGEAPVQAAPPVHLPGERRQRPAPLELSLALPLVERALQVLERRGVQPQLGLLKSTMLQLDSAFNERAYGAGSFSDFVDKLKRAEMVQVTGQGGRYIIERKSSAPAAKPNMKPEDLLTPLRDVLENHRLELENGAPVDDLAGWFREEQSHLDIGVYGFQAFNEFLNYAQDKTVVRMEPHPEEGIMMVTLGAEFYPPAEPLPPAPPPQTDDYMEEEDEPQPYVEGQPTIFEPNPPPAKAKKAPARKRAPRASGSGSGSGSGGGNRRTPRRKKTD